MNETIKKPDRKFYIFLAGIIIFTIMAVLGWIKLHYGFNFGDEGYHMAASWRLTAGDHFLKDRFTGATFLYTLINSLIFKIYPDVSLLQFRQLQFILTIAALLIFGVALFRQTRKYVWLPFAFSLFAFTGLDPLGMISNLNYHTYPHLFITLYLAFLLLGLNSQKPFLRNFYFILSGLILWTMCLSTLPISFVFLSPLILLFFSRRFNPEYCIFTFRDMLYVLLPYVICWLVFIGIFNKAYIINIINSLSVSFSIPYYTKRLGIISWVVIKPTIISTVFLLLFFIFIKKFPLPLSITGCTILSAFIFLIINTSLFGHQPLYYIALPSKPLWFSSLIIAFSILFWLNIILKLLYKKEFNKEEILFVILMIPFSIVSMIMSTFSGLRANASANYAIPAVVAMSYVLVSSIKKNKYGSQLNVLFLLLLLGPFYYTTAKNDWDFTYYDVPPKLANVKIETGFGRGIYTNELYDNVYKWIDAKAKEYTQPGEYSISYIVSPMVHMITRLRPSLDDSYVTSLKPPAYYKKAIEEMERLGREPKIAFIFERILALIPATPDHKSFFFPPRELDFPSSTDPISRYVKTHMTPAAEFEISDNNIIRCYVEKKRFAQKALDKKINKLIKKINNHPENGLLYYKLGLLFEQNNNLKKAAQAFQQSLTLNPNSFQTLNRLMMLQIKEKNYTKAIAILSGPMLKLQPGNADIYYNIACLFSLQKNQEKAIEWLRRALEKGYDNWGKIKTDPDLENIRNSLYYHNLIKNHQLGD